jgi:hypothetical protein
LRRQLAAHSCTVSARARLGLNIATNAKSDMTQAKVRISRPFMMLQPTESPRRICLYVDQEAPSNGGGGNGASNTVPNAGVVFPPAARAPAASPEISIALICALDHPPLLCKHDGSGTRGGMLERDCISR